MIAELTTTEFIQEMIANLDREVEIVNERSDYKATLDAKPNRLTLTITMKESAEPFVVTVFHLKPQDPQSENQLADQLEETYILLSQLTENNLTEKGVDPLCL